MKFINHKGLFISDELLKLLKKDVQEEYETLITNQYRFLSEFCPFKSHKDDDVHHTIFALNEDLNEIAGFRYFYYPFNSKDCELFNIYISPEYRQKGLGSKLIETSITEALNKGITNFIVRMASKTPERDALANKYKSISEKFIPKCKFTIYYDNKITTHR